MSLKNRQKAGSATWREKKSRMAVYVKMSRYTEKKKGMTEITTKAQDIFHQRPTPIIIKCYPLTFQVDCRRLLFYPDLKEDKGGR